MELSRRFILLLLSFIALAQHLHVLATTTHASDLICHSKNLQDCYPRVFEPTSDFQVVHDDQEIPSGLHVRLNLETGVKEAKLNDGESEDDQSLIANTVKVTAGAPASNAILSLPEPDKQDTEPDANIQLPEQLMQQVLQASLHKPRKPTVDSDADSAAFENAIATLGLRLESDPSQTPWEAVKALETLEDLCHDIYWGLSLVQHPRALNRLFALLGSDPSWYRWEPDVAGAAALTLGNAIHNNPGSLKHLKESGNLTTLYYLTTNALGIHKSAAASLSAAPHHLEPQDYSRLMYLLSALCQDNDILNLFTHSRGLTVLRSSKHFNASSAGSDDGAWDRPRRQIADFVTDHFLAIGSPGNKVGIPTEEVVEAIRTEPAPRTDDAWILVDGDISSDPEVICELASWCTTFKEALQRWEAAGTDTGDNIAVEHVKEAYGLLPDVLAAKPYSCGGCAA